MPVLAGCGADATACAPASRPRSTPSSPRCPSRIRSSSSPSPARSPARAQAEDNSGGIAKEPSTPKPTEAASGTLARKNAPSAINGGTHNATALDNGVALPPLEAPTEVLKIIEAGNSIARTPYKWGGGHGRFLDSGYDCSGSVSFALYAAGLIDGPEVAAGLMHWGKPGKGKWITVYANAGHTYMEVAGIRFDTSGAKVTGSRWQNELRTNAGFVARHPAGL